jgi:hypothetical protein
MAAVTESVENAPLKNPSGPPVLVKTCANTADDTALDQPYLRWQAFQV